MPEELAGQEIGGDGAAVLGNERHVGPRPVVVDGARHQLLAGARFSREQDRAVAPSGAFDQLECVA